MIFIVRDGSGAVRFMSRNWPMSRAALDLVISENAGCPALDILPDDVSVNLFSVEEV